MMTLQTFQNGLDRWGSSLTNWPRREQRAARALLAADAEARRQWALAEQLARSLQRPPAALGNDALRRRLKTIPAHYVQPSRLPAATSARGWRGGWWAGGVAVAGGGVMALGFLAGFTGLMTLDGGLVDWAALAYGSL
jgi:hypothetical protein